MSSIKIYGCKSLCGNVSLPSSKPHMQRALFYAYLNPKLTTINNISWCSETRLLYENLSKLGLNVIEERGTSLTLQGVRNYDHLSNIEVYVEGSGFLFRVMVALSSLTEKLIIRCNKSLYDRKSVVDESYLKFLGVSISKDNDDFVFRTSKQENKSNSISIANSSQFLTIALMIAPFILQNQIFVSDKWMGEGYLDITEKFISEVGYSYEKNKDSYIFNHIIQRDINITIPTDFTSIGYVASSILSVQYPSSIVINDYIFGNTKNEIFMYECFKKLGVNFIPDQNTLIVSNKAKDPHYINLRAIQMSLKELPSIATSLISASHSLTKVIEFNDLSHINNHKCNRIFVISENLRKLGASILFLFNDSGRFTGLQIKQGQLNHNCTVLKSYRDHRVCAGNIIMSLRSREFNIIEDIETLSDGYPNFITDISNCGVRIEYC